MRAENIPEEQVREYIVRYFPWKDGEGFKGAGPSDDYYCPECDQGFADQDVETNEAAALLCPKCKREVFHGSAFLPEKADEEVKAPETKPSEEEPKGFTPKLVE